MQLLFDDAHRLAVKVTLLLIAKTKTKRYGNILWLVHHLINMVPKKMCVHPVWRALLLLHYVPPDVKIQEKGVSRHYLTPEIVLRW